MAWWGLEGEPTGQEETGISVERGQAWVWPLEQFKLVLLVFVEKVIFTHGQNNVSSIKGPTTKTPFLSHVSPQSAFSEDPCSQVEPGLWNVLYLYKYQFLPKAHTGAD